MSPVELTVRAIDMQTGWTPDMGAQITFNGLPFSDTIVRLLRKQLCAIRESAPYGAVVSCDLRSAGALVTGTISLASAGGSFSSRATHRSVSTVIEEIMVDLKHQVRSWMRSRQLPDQGERRPPSETM